MARILVTETLADAGLDAMRAAGHDVDVQLDLTPAALLDAVRGVHALVIRSATKVTEEVLSAGTDLVVVGRAGIGLDNVDVATASRRGVMVVNAPQANTIAMAEHTMALLLSQARNIPQSSAALKGGQWQRSRWEGVELHGKTLGVLGLGPTGTLLAQRAHAFGMRLLAWDPWVSPDRGRQTGVKLVELDELFAEADFVTVHLKKTADSMGLVGADLLKKAKPGLRIINAARGGIVDEEALADAVREGRIAGAALDVFTEEPCTSSPLFALDSVVVTPHLGASTREAQDKAGITIAEQVTLALAGEFVPFAVNVAAAEASETVRPFVAFAEQLGAIFASLTERLPDTLEIACQGALADYDTSILTLSVLKGLLSLATEEQVSYVNAPQLAEDRGLEVRETKSSTAHDYVNLITLRGGDHALAGTMFGSQPRIVMLDEHSLELPPGRNMLVVRNEDRPGRIGLVTTLLGDAGVNISDIHVGRTAAGQAALMALTTDGPVPANVLDELRRIDGIVEVHAINLE